MGVTTWGFSVPFQGLTLPEHTDFWSELADHGYGSVWTSESASTDAITPLGLAAAEPRLDLGCAVVSTFTRAPSVLAVTAATLARVAPGRVRFGLGASSPNIVSGWNGIAFDHPYSKTRDVLRFLRQALAGERVRDHFDTFSSNGFRLVDPPSQPPELLLAALRPRMLALAGDEADGVILNWVSASDVRRLVDEVRSRNPKARIVDRVMVCPTGDFNLVHKTLAPIVAAYLSTPVYRKFYEWLGHASWVDPVASAWEQGERSAAIAAVPDELIDAVCVWGTPERCRSGLSAYADAGVTDPVLALVSSTPVDRSTVAKLLPVDLDRQAHAGKDNR
ncbi:LLM class F420-dependent oxidoreductase [Nocardia abscessus]|uniref:LLM class F420-dependent oxidoreductase n=1 Tax=Nocardia TaxID=1817 RepID=UPI001895F631|nr:LLM class F420-dependent oxidoreductase [Nocardia abscessus]MBF6207824.1 LLM class F420-dependent oxidoreductase [Streptomyces gardneri]MBF6472611.1 LLM class F420-dependent oxidoreductase [Nocardia abscessus]